ncbi:naringenin 3-dioxygenase [Viridothelium virens]|uniref:Naringenin 3-dioxygenase n=1 Tax=Viridothelium virens TaxID=1048519 RepID=A0A6A6HDJ9_VIRVR|nr:naringenin 3-dioxygenase [Viridothelium virens]
MAANFNAIPTLPLAQARDPKTKSAFLDDLRSALLNVGFLYLSETGLDEELVERVCAETRRFFEELPEDEKLKIEMKNEKSFLGYSRLGNETTARAADQREQLDLSTPHDLPAPTAPLYHNLLAPNQWPSPTHLPTFRPILEEYMQQMSSISTFFTSLIAEAIGLAPSAFTRFFDPNQQHKLKIIKYPEMPPRLSIPSDHPSSNPLSDNDDDSDDSDSEALARARASANAGRRSSLKEAGHEARAQGVGPHKDSMLTSYLLQASPQRGLQAQNPSGRWIEVPPVEGTLVVAIGQGLEALTGGVCASTTHRVLSPLPGEGARYSVPFFQGVSYDAVFESVEVPEGVRELRRGVLKELGGSRRDDVEFTFVKGRWGHLGEATLMNRVKSHPDVGERWVSVMHFLPLVVCGFL